VIDCCVAPEERQRLVTGCEDGVEKSRPPTANTKRSEPVLQQENMFSSSTFGYLPKQKRQAFRLNPWVRHSEIGQNEATVRKPGQDTTLIEIATEIAKEHDAAKA
jgi:hypothetical protein